MDDVLHEIGAGELPIEVVLNKIDRVDPLGRRRLSNRFPSAPQVSALTGEGMADLQAELARRFDDRWERVRLLVPYESGGRLSELYALGTPIEERDDTPEGVLVDRQAAPPRPAAVRAVPRRRGGRHEPGVGLIELLIQKVRPNAVVPVRAYCGGRRPRPLRPATGSSSRRVSGRSCRPGSPSRSPRGTPATSSPVRAWPRSTASRSSTRPGSSTRATAASCSSTSSTPTATRRSSSRRACASRSS